MSKPLPDFHRARAACFAHLPEAEHHNLLNVMNAAAIKTGVAGFVIGALCGAGITFGVTFLLLK